MIIKAIEILTTYSNGNKKVLAEVECSRCSGNGRLESYRAVDNGICFKCGGLGVEKKEITVKPNEEIEMIEETTAIKPLKKINDHEALRNSMLQSNEEKKAKKQAYKDLLEREEKERMELEEDKKNNPENYSMSWDD